MKEFQQQQQMKGGGSSASPAPTGAPPPPPPPPPKESFARRYKFMWPLLLTVNLAVGGHSLFPLTDSFNGSFKVMDHVFWMTCIFRFPFLGLLNAFFDSIFSWGDRLAFNFLIFGLNPQNLF